jgi:hypothetical protein
MSNEYECPVCRGKEVLPDLIDGELVYCEVCGGSGFCSADDLDAYVAAHYPVTLDAASHLGQLRHLYDLMMHGHVRDTKEAARGLLAPAIAHLERRMTPMAKAPKKTSSKKVTRNIGPIKSKGPLVLSEKTLNEILVNLTGLVVRGEVDRSMFVGLFSDFLNELTGNDFFGTEGQLDPRGDRR